MSAEDSSPSYNLLLRSTDIPPFATFSLIRMLRWASNLRTTILEVKRSVLPAALLIAVNHMILGAQAHLISFACPLPLYFAQQHMFENDYAAEEGEDPEGQMAVGVEGESTEGELEGEGEGEREVEKRRATA